MQINSLLWVLGHDLSTFGGLGMPFSRLGGDAQRTPYYISTNPERLEAQPRHSTFWRILRAIVGILHEHL